MTEPDDGPRLKVAIIAAGAAGSYCGACTRDVALARAMVRHGHDVQVLPLYTPLRADGPDPSVRRVFFGGINVYLEQRWSLFRHVPRFVNWLLDRPALLKFACRFGIETRPEELGEMTVSMLEGGSGRQVSELDSMLDYLSDDGGPPDAVILSNSLLLGLGPDIKDRLGSLVCCSLQGEESFVSRLTEPWHSRACDLIQDHATHIDAFLSPGEAYCEEMAEFLAVSEEKMHLVRTGVEIPDSTPERRPTDPFQPSFLSRLCETKGLDTLCEAFVRMKEAGCDNAVLRVAGQANAGDLSFWQDCMTKLRKRGLEDAVDYRGEVGEVEKAEFFRQASVFCLPERYPEPRGVACLEAMAWGAPALVPDHGIFPEIAELTGGARCLPPEDPDALAEALQELYQDPDKTAEMGRAAARGVAEHFSAEGMARRTEDLLYSLQQD